MKITFSNFRTMVVAVDYTRVLLYYYYLLRRTRSMVHLATSEELRESKAGNGTRYHTVEILHTIPVVINILYFDPDPDFTSVWRVLQYRIPDTKDTGTSTVPLF
jgi:hypothetical protein